MNRQDSIVGTLQNFFQQKAERFKVQIAFLYGSWAKGLPRNDSDVDVAIVFDDEPSEEELFERLTTISLLLSEKIGLEVNVISIYNDFRKPVLYYNAIVMGVSVYIKDFTKYVTLINEAIYQAEDFEIFGSGWYQTLSRKNLEAIRYA
jgi:predicted nucleotidyltransferase